MNEKLTRTDLKGSPGTYFYKGLRIITNLACIIAQPVAYGEELEGRMVTPSGDNKVSTAPDLYEVIGVIRGDIKGTVGTFMLTEYTLDDLLKIKDEPDDDVYWTYGKHFGLHTGTVKNYIKELDKLDPFDVVIYTRDVNYQSILIIDVDAETTLCFAPVDLRAVEGAIQKKL